MTITHVNGSVIHDPAPGPRQAPQQTFASELKSLSTFPGAKETDSPIIQILNQYQPPFSDIASRTWFSHEYETLARTALRGVIASAYKNRPDFIPFTLTGLMDAYNMDRALHAEALLHNEPYNSPPILLKDMPPRPANAPGPDGDYIRNITPLGDWEAGTPFSVLTEVVTLLEQEIPDHMILVKYRKRQQQLDPILYAIYGPWHVKVSEWK